MILENTFFKRPPLVASSEFNTKQKKVDQGVKLVFKTDNKDIKKNLKKEKHRNKQRHINNKHVYNTPENKHVYSTPEKHLGKVLDMLQVLNKERNLYC